MRRGGPKKDIEKCTRGVAIKVSYGRRDAPSSHQSPVLFQGPVNGK